VRGRLTGPAAAVLLALLGGGLGLLAASRTWVLVRVDDPLTSALTLQASGRVVAPVVPALALVALAGAVALLLARAIGRRVTGLLLVLAGAAVVAATASAATSPRAAVRDVVGQAVGTTGQHVSTQVTGWPWLAAAAGVVVATSGALPVLLAGRWARSATSRAGARFDSPARSDPPSDPAHDSFGTWDALSRGSDPTGPTGGPPRE
jgi:uncharacterized membrane protein (TIGR02234 family)